MPVFSLSIYLCSASRLWNITDKIGINETSTLFTHYCPVDHVTRRCCEKTYMDSRWRQNSDTLGRPGKSTESAS